MNSKAIEDRQCMRPKLCNFMTNIDESNVYILNFAKSYQLLIVIMLKVHRTCFNDCDIILSFDIISNFINLPFKHTMVTLELWHREIIYHIQKCHCIMLFD